MANLETKNVRNIAIVGHGSCGKTILTDAMLFNAKVSTRIGEIEAGTTISDYTEEEHERKNSIYTSIMNCDWDSKKLFLMDTPGFADYFGEVISAINVCDSAIVVIDAVSGIEVNTRKAWKMLQAKNIPTLIFVTKLDRENTDFDKVMAQIKEMMGANCVPVQFPVGEADSLSGVVNMISGKGLDSAPDDVKSMVESAREALVEAAAESDDDLLEKYLEAGELTEEEFASGLSKGVYSGTLTPVLCGSGTKNIGVAELLDTAASLLPSPEERGDIKSADGENSRKPAADDPFSAFVFKTITDPFVGQLTYFRVYSGTLKSDTEVFNVTKNQRERIGHLYIVQGKEQQEVSELVPGCIGALAKLKVTKFGDTFADSSNQITYHAIEFPKPVVFMAVKAKAKGEDDKVGTGLTRLVEEDPTLNLNRNAATKELVLEGAGDMQLEMVVHRLKSKFHVEVEMSIPKVAYKETIKGKGQGHKKHKKQSGGRGQYGEAYVRVEPNHGAGFEFVDAIVGGVIPRNFIPAVEKGIVGALDEGVLANCPMIDIKATVYDGSFHAVDSSEIAFKIAGARAFKDAVASAKPVLLEPIMKVAVTVPSEYMGDITGDLNSKRGRVLGMEPDGNMQVIKATIPQAEIFHYSSEIRSMTGGRGSFEMEFDRYDEVPANVAQKIVAETKKSDEEK
jgi:elongation factor G